MTVTAKQLRLKTSEVLKSIARGGSVTVTLRGKPVAKLVSLEETRERKLTDFAAFGMWAGRKDMEDPVAWVRRIGNHGIVSIDLRHRYTFRQETGLWWLRLNSYGLKPQRS